jgi:4-amino-4-deoxy-L-arabinose transferase-like glycosyltransferase
MSQQEEVKSVPISIPAPFPSAEKEGTLLNTGARPRARARAFFAYLWGNRAMIFGGAAIVLAVGGEWLQRAGRGTPEAPAWAQAGMVLSWLAVLCLLPVAWVNDGWPQIKWRRKKRPVAVVESEGTDVDSNPHLYIVPTRRVGSRANTTVESAGTDSEPNLYSVPTRRAGGRAASPVVVAAPRPALTKRLARVRPWLGMVGTLAGLAIAVALGATVALMVRSEFTNPLTPYVWLAMLAALVLTFVGVRPKGGAIQAMPHDPHEPADEPRTTRAEWLAVGVIMLAAVLLRFVDLASIPVGPYIDESGRALVARAINAGQPVENLPFSFFGTSWWGVPNMYFWVEAQFLALFGDNLLAARIMHALAGVGTVWFTYRLGRLAWSPRVGLVAGALMAVSDFAIQFSRTAGESTILIFTWVVCFYYLYKGIKTQRPLDFVWSGIAGGLCLYSYASGKLLPPFLVALALFMVVRWGVKGARRFVPLLALMGLTAGLTFLPNAVFLVTKSPEALTARSSGVGIFGRQNMEGLKTEYGTDNVGEIVARQFAVTWSAFDVGKERGPFYPTDQPILPVPWAALWLLGTAYAVYRAGDVRYAGLGVWLLAGLAGAALTNDTPTLQRVAGMVPMLALLPAVVVDRVVGARRWTVDGGPRTIISSHPRSTVHRLPSAVGNALVVSLVLLLGWLSVSFYFGTYVPRKIWLNPTLAGRYLENLDPERDVAYTFNLPAYLGDPSPTIFLANGVPGRDYNPGEDIPLNVEQDQTVHFLTHPANTPLLSVLKDLYPDGKLTMLIGEDGNPFISAYAVDGPAREKMQHSVARYGASSQAIERSELRLGTLGERGEADDELALPAELSYPAQAQWSGGIVAPHYGKYVLELDAPGGGSLEIDGRVLLTVPPGAGAAGRVEVVLARGTHIVRLAGTLESAEGRVDLKWGTSGSLRPVGRRFLWNGAHGALLGTAYASSDPGWFVSPEISVTGAAPTSIRRDGFLSWWGVNIPLRGSTYVFCRWQGTLIIQEPGDYVFNPTGDGNMALWLDGTPVAGQGVEGVPAALPLTIHLEAGPHAFELRFQATKDNAALHLQWQKPGGQMELIPPSAFSPSEGGAWPATEIPGAPDLGAGAVEP